jgi:hypothetical protein
MHVRLSASRMPPSELLAPCCRDESDKHMDGDAVSRARHVQH